MAIVSSNAFASGCPNRDNGACPTSIEFGAPTSALDALARIISGTDDVTVVPWTALRHQHTYATRLLLAHTYDAATGDLYLTVLRGLLRTAWQRGRLPKGEYLQAADLISIDGGYLWEGRNAALANEFNARIDLDLTEFAPARMARQRIQD